MPPDVDLPRKTYSFGLQDRSVLQHRAVFFFLLRLLRLNAERDCYIFINCRYCQDLQKGDKGMNYYNEILQLLRSASDVQLKRLYHFIKAYLR